MSPLDQGDNETQSLMQVFAPASFLSGEKDLPSPESSPELFDQLVTAAPLISAPLDSEFSLSSPSVKCTSDLASQDCLTELMLDELPFLNLYPHD